MSDLVAIILCRDEKEHLAPCIESVQFADEIVVFVDSGSPILDDMIAIVQQYGARVEQRRFDNWADHRNAALASVTADWVLFVDVDERIPTELAAEVRQTIEDAEAVGYGIPRHNYIFGKLTRHTGWYPDYQVRLLHRTSAAYDPDHPVHEIVILDGPTDYLTQPMIHYNYRDLDHFIAKQRRYAEIDAGILFDEGVRTKPQNYILQPLRQFKWRYFELQGYRDGLHGLRLSLLMAWYEWLKYRNLSARYK